MLMVRSVFFLAKTHGKWMRTFTLTFRLTVKKIKPSKLSGRSYTHQIVVKVNTTSSPSPQSPHIGVHSVKCMPGGGGITKLSKMWIHNKFSMNLGTINFSWAYPPPRQFPPPPDHTPYHNPQGKLDLNWLGIPGNFMENFTNSRNW